MCLLVAGRTMLALNRMHRTTKHKVKEGHVSNTHAEVLIIPLLKRMQRERAEHGTAEAGRYYITIATMNKYAHDP